MDKLSVLIQYNSVLLKASTTLRQISNLLRDGQVPEAIALRNYYKCQLEPLIKGLSTEKKN